MGVLYIRSSQIFLAFTFFGIAAIRLQLLTTPFSTMHQVISTLLEHRSAHSLSLYMPTHYREFADRERIRRELKHLIQKAKQLLDGVEMAHTERNKLVARLEQFADQLQPSANGSSAVAFFATSGFSQQLYLPTMVSARVVLGDSFQIRELLDSLHQLEPYYVLLLSQKHTRLFRGQAASLEEAEDDAFPSHYQEQYEHQPGSAHSLYTEDAQKSDQAHYAAFLHLVARRLATYPTRRLLVVMGEAKALSLYKKYHEGHAPLELDLAANHEKLSAHDLSKLVWPLVQSQLQAEEQSASVKLRERLQESEGLLGMHPVWAELYFPQRGYTHLVVARDYEQEGWILPDGHLSLHPTTSGKHQPRLVEHLVETVLQRKGERLSLVDPAALQGLGPIALLPY